MRSLKVTIVGAGIGGLSCAVALRDSVCDVQVFERAPELLPIGAGICMWPNGAAALRVLNCSEELDDISPILRELSYLDKDGSPLRTMSLADMTERVGQRSYPLARSDLHDALRSQIDDEVVVLDAECVGVEQHADSVETIFLDGTRVKADLLIGADGVRSVIRPHVVGDTAVIHHYYDTWVGLVPSRLELTPADTFTFHVGEQQRVGLLDVGRQRTYFFCDAPAGRHATTGSNDPCEQLSALFAGWSPRVRRLIDHVDPGTVRLPVCDMDPLPTFVSERIALLGDAAHTTTPTLGQGGALAMEDSLVLGRHLAEHGHLGDALAAYDAERRPRSTHVVRAARARTQAMLGVISEAEASWYRRLRDNASQDFIDQLIEFAESSPFLSAPRRS